MASLTQVATSGDFTIYDVESLAWASPEVWTFDGRTKMAVDSDGVIDVVIMAEGFTSGDQAAFVNDVSNWYDRFAVLWPYSEFLSAFRVRAVFAASAARAGAPGGTTYYGLGVDPNNKVASGAENNTDFINAVFDTMEAVDNAVGLNKRLYPADLLIGRSGDMPSENGVWNSARGDSTFSNRARNLVAVLTVMRHTGGIGGSGYYTTLEAPEGHSMEGMRLSSALGEHDLHEFGHAFGLLKDEYISDGMRNRYSDNIHQDASNPSVFDLFNVTYTGMGKAVPWRHLSSDGLTQRNGNSYVGQMWIGGGATRGVWHSEYKCLQNGGHHNYHHRTDESRGYANLRTHDRYCLWCEEIITIRILEKTGAFCRDGDPLDDASIVELGSIWYRRWEDEMRAVYWRQFSMDQRIVDRETWYHDPANLQNSAWNGDLTNTNLMREITEEPYRGLPSILLT
jgi:hypothetical protein